MTTMATARTYRLYLACPPAELAALQSFLYALGRPVGSVDLVLEAGVDGQPPVLYRVGSDTFTDEEVTALRPWISPGGAGYEAGMRFRRGLNTATEIAAPDVSPGKLTVTVIEEGEPIPPNVDWADTRLTFPRFLEELGVGIVEPAI
jgi:hypothetical protein